MQISERVVVLDFGGQYTHLIARRCRELGVYSEILPHNVELEDVVSRGGVKAIILSGGPRSVYEEGAPMLSGSILHSRLPTLGICYGHQLIAHMLGGRTERAERAEYGRTPIHVYGDSLLLAGLPERFNVWMSHGDSVLEPPSGFSVTARTESGLIAAMERPEMGIFTVQFHPEVRHTERGLDILGNFLRRIGGFREEWRPVDRLGEIVRETRERMRGGGSVICGVSGGVDSMTTAAILNRAVGERLHVVFVDHGLLRKGEREEVLRALNSLGVKNIHFIDASDIFLSRLRGVSDPEEKRRIIGELFAKIFEEVASRVSDARFLGQGTIYPDRVESGSTGAATGLIKSHHNVAGLPPGLRLTLIEPLGDFYKDEVRVMAAEIGLPPEIIRRHPFPGPGLAVRIVGEVTEERLRICREANAIVEEEFARAGIYEEVWQAFAVVLDSKWVGVKGDAREEGYIVIVRAVTSEDGMTADWYPLPHEVLDRIARRLTNEVRGVVMVAYAASSKPPSTIEAC